MNIIKTHFTNIKKSIPVIFRTYLDIMKSFTDADNSTILFNEAEHFDELQKMGKRAHSDDIFFKMMNYFEKNGNSGIAKSFAEKKAQCKDRKGLVKFYYVLLLVLCEYKASMIIP